MENGNYAAERKRPTYCFDDEGFWIQTCPDGTVFKERAVTCLVDPTRNEPGCYGSNLLAEIETLLQLEGTRLSPQDAAFLRYIRTRRIKVAKHRPDGLAVMLESKTWLRYKNVVRATLRKLGRYTDAHDSISTFSSRFLTKRTHHEHLVRTRDTH